MSQCCGTRRIYRYAPPAEPGLRARWWGPAAGPHLDPLEWAGPADPATGFPLPTAAAPDFDVINNGANTNDSSSGAGAARYGIISGWVFLPDGVTHWRDNNANTGELGMVLTGTCCGGALVEQPGGNHTASTVTADRTLMDPTPVTGGWHYVVNPQSDTSAFQGLDLEYSLSGDTGPWINVAEKQPEKPTVEAVTISCCQEVPDGWSIDPLTECCQPTYQAGGDAGLDEDAVQALIDASAPDVPQAATAVPVPDNEVDTAIRTGQVGTSADFARADHNHPIRRQANPGDPVVVQGGNLTITQALILDRWSTEESYSYRFRVRGTQPAGTGWGWITVPTIGGFQQPKIGAIGTYRSSSTEIQNDDGAFGAAPRGPYMGAEAHHWSSTNRVYAGFFRRDDANTSTFYEFTVDYVRA